VEGLDVDVVIAAASPWSRQKDDTSARRIPSNVTVRKFSQYELRQLYADCEFLVMPLQPVEFQAGVTAILEAMAMGKAVVCSRTPGQTDVVVEGENGRYVPVGDPAALRAEITRLLAQPGEIARLGANARDRVVRELSLDHYAERLSTIVQDTLGASRA
jgi:glycosyltransferase involved in cell wall biosynthesis